MAELYLESRLEFLRRVQNADGGWGYFPGKTSWMEPTAYAAMALQYAPGAGDACEHAWRRILSWQTPDGSWRPGEQVRDTTWVTALGLLVACSRGTFDPRIQKTVSWLVRMRGSESSWPFQLASYFHTLQSRVDVSHRGFPWRPGTSAWIEPTALSVLALKKSAAGRPDSAVEARARDGQDLIFARRARDGGWNCGNSNVLEVDLPSYPETTALALIGLQGRPAGELASPLETLRRFCADCKSPLAKAWLTIALRCHRQPVPWTPGPSGPPQDILLCALQALAHPQGRYTALMTGGLA